MFKSIFAKYVTAFMLIITFGFALLLLVISSIVGTYSIENKEKILDSAAEATRAFLEGETESATPERFSAILAHCPTEQLEHLLEAFSAHDPEIALLISDIDGNILYFDEGEGLLSESAKRSDLPKKVCEAVLTGGSFSSSIAVDFAQRGLWMRAVGVYNGAGEVCGIIAVCSADTFWSDTVEGLAKTVISSACLVLLATLIAAYFITERTIAPLREMSMAARNFAAGKFDHRLSVRGRDEVAELADAFNHMAESLENLEKMRNSFVANVSHDLRTPMTTIAGFIDGIRDGVIPPEERDHYLEVVSSEVHRLSRLVASLLDLSRMQAGDRKFNMRAFDICEMGRQILISFEQQIEEKRLEVAFECEEERLWVLADHDAVYQVFYNICHNALKFSREGGALRIRLVTTREKKIQISVYNDGKGIPYEDQAYIFERFYKSDKSRSLDKTGTGLGLYIAKTIVAAHGEKIWVVSKPGENCEFFFTLPRTPHNA